MYYNLLPQIKNAKRARKDMLITPFSQMDLAVLQVLADNGYIKSAARKEVGRKAFIEIKLREGGFNDFKIISKPSRRLYSSYRELRAIKQNEGIAVLSTPRGIFTNRTARKEKQGGEYLFEIW